MPQKYRVTTDRGTYEVTVGEEAAPYDGSALHPTIGAMDETGKPFQHEPDTWWGGVGKSLKDQVLHATVDNPALQGAAHPQTASDIAGLMLAPVDAARAGSTIASNAINTLTTPFRRIPAKVMDAGLWRTRAQRLDFPNTPARLVDEGILPYQAEGALRKTEGAIQAKAQKYDAATTAGQVFPTGAQRRIDPQPLADQAATYAHEAGQVGGLGDTPGPEAADIERARQSYLAQNRRPHTLTETVAQKRAYAARTSYDTRPNAPPVTNEVQNFNKGIAHANRDAAIAREPSLAEDLSREQDLMGADAAHINTENRGTPMTVPGLVRHLAFGPNAMGSAAITLDRVGQMLPAASRLALMKALFSAEAEK